MLKYKIVAIDDENTDSFKLGVKLLRNKNYGEAVHAFMLAIKQKSNNADAYYHRGTAYAALWPVRIKKDDVSKLKKAAADFEKVLFLKPDHAGAKNNLEIVQDLIAKHPKPIRR